MVFHSNPFPPGEHNRQYTLSFFVYCARFDLYSPISGGIVNNTLRPAIPNSCDPEWKRLMEQCWAPNPVVRPTFTEITNRLRVMAAACQTRAHIRKASS